MCSALITRTPSGTISWACWAAEPCHTPSTRVARPPTAAASGTVASTTSWCSRSAPLRLVSVSDWLRKGTQSTTTSAFAAASAFSIALEMAVGQGRPGALGGLGGPGGIARAEHDRHAGAAPAQRQAEAERAGGTDDRNGLGQGRRVYVQVQVTQLPQSVRIREVGPRDGFQNEPEVIATDDKVRLVDVLMRTGLRRIEATSFVRADVIPQLADADQVLARIDRPPDVSVSVLIPNERGLQNALVSHGRFQEVNVFLSASETHNRKNVNRSIRESLVGSSACSATPARRACAARRSSRWPSAAPTRAMSRPSACSTSPARLAARAPRSRLRRHHRDGQPGAGARFFEQARAVLGDEVELTAHFHNTRGQGLANVLAALEVGRGLLRVLLRRAGGLPGPAGATGNIATEDLVSMLHEMGIETGSTSRRCSTPRGRRATSSAARWAATRWWPGAVDWHHGRRAQYGRGKVGEG